MICKELLGTANLIRAWTLCIYKSIIFIIVCKNKDIIITAFQVMVPNFESFNNRQRYLIVNLVSSFNRVNFLKIKCYKMLLIYFGLKKS